MTHDVIAQHVRFNAMKCYMGQHPAQKLVGNPSPSMAALSRAYIAHGC